VIFEVVPLRVEILRGNRLRMRRRRRRKGTYVTLLQASGEAGTFVSWHGHC